MNKLNKHLLNWESVRAQTFNNSVWYEHNKITDVNALARSGLFYYGESDYTQCFACGVCIGMWVVGETPSEEHARFRPFCPMVLDLPVGNITLEEEKAIPLFTYLPEKLQFNCLKHRLYQDTQPAVGDHTTTATLPKEIAESLEVNSEESENKPWKRVRIIRRHSCTLPNCKMENPE